ncbi:hypothetical protein BDV97DRAFT_361042 [Delphinella strobiligena]|nr:hypothetical protein BDV97DRAFT_361042 [Delphinella strobiligena]
MGSIEASWARTARLQRLTTCSDCFLSRAPHGDELYTAIRYLSKHQYKSRPFEQSMRYQS